MVKIEDVLYVTIFITITAIATASFLQQQAEQRGITDLDTSYNDSFNSLDQVQNSTEQVRTKMETSTLFSTEGIAALFNGSFSILRLIFNIVFLPISITYKIAVTLGMPWYAGMCLASLWIIAVALAVINIITGRPPT